MGGMWTRVLTEIVVVLGWQLLRTNSFFDNLRYKVGIGSKNHFWEDPWMECDSFFLRFLWSYSLSLEKNTLINMVHSPKSWNFRFKINLNDWQVEDFTSMLLELEEVEIRVDYSNRRIWTNNSSVCLTCKSYFEILEDNLNE